jgi:hypothetical protein
MDCCQIKIFFYHTIAENARFGFVISDAMISILFEKRYALIALGGLYCILET